MSRIAIRRRVARNAQRGLTLLEIMIVIAILGILVAVIAPKVMDALGESKVETTKMRVNRYTTDWYIRWNMKAEKPCPDSLLEVARAVDTNAKESETLDAWKQPLKFMCGDNLPAGAKGIAVYSVGENGKDEHDVPGSDDIRSWGGK